MPKGYAIHIGVNQVSADCYFSLYSMVPSPLKACIEDALQFAQLSQSFQYAERYVLLNEEATVSRLEELFGQIEKKIMAGDLLLVSFSGHGGQIPDIDYDEEDGQDELWCLYDDIWLDDQLYSFLSRLASGVRVLVVSDSCHSGGMNRFPFEDDTERARWDQFHPFEGLLQKTNRSVTDSQILRPAIQASVMIFAACREAEKAQDNVFTKLMITVIQQKAFKGNYTQLFQSLFPRLPVRMNAQMLSLGPPDLAFSLSQPFSIPKT